MSDLKIQNLTKYIIDKKMQSGVAVIYEASATFKSNQINVILGPSGCGKTMLLKAICGLEAIDEGHIYFGDEEITNVEAKKRGFSYLSQNYALYPHLTVFDNVAYPLRLQKIEDEELRRRVRETLKFLNIEHLSSKKPKQLSGGQCQMVAIARSIIKHPRLILLDEPLSNIDMQSRQLFIETFKRIRSEYHTTMIYVTHALREAYQLADYIVIMDNGTIVEEGPIEALLSDKNSILVKDYVEVTSDVNLSS